MKKITLLFALLFGLYANAQWTSNTAENTLVADSNPTGSQSVGTNSGKTYTVFWKNVGAPTNFELRAQLVDENGVQQFGADGMLVTNALPMGTYTVVYTTVADSKDNLYIGVTGTGTGTNCMIYKISPAGQHLWTEGVNLGSGYVPKIKPLANDDVIVTYWNGGKGKITRLDAQGQQIWPNAIDIASSAAYASNNTVGGDIFEHANGDFTLVFHVRLSSSIPSLLFAQRYTSAGTAIWAEPTQLANVQTAYNNMYYSSAQDGDVVYYGYSGSHDNRFDSYLQRINPDGTIPWGINGKDFDTNQTNFEKDTKIAFTPGSDYIWAISLYTNTSQSQAGEYVQKFDKVTGERLFTETAKVVFPIVQDASVHAVTSDLELVNDAPLFIVKTGYDNGVSPIVLNAVFLDQNGDFILDDQLLPVATFAAAKGDIALGKMVNGQAVVAFAEEKTANQEKIYVQNFMMPAEVCVPTLTLHNVTAEVDENGNVTLTGTEFDNGSTDSCGSIETWTWTIEPATFTCQNLGEQTVTITVENTSGATATGTATITITDPNNYCNTAGTEDFNSQTLAVYPNPAKDVVYIRPAAGTTITAVTVYSVIGQKLYSAKNETATGELSVSLSQLQTGTYLVNVETNTGTFTKQIIKN